jgi:hypothetical protein
VDKAGRCDKCIRQLEADSSELGSFFGDAAIHHQFIHPGQQPAGCRQELDSARHELGSGNHRVRQSAASGKALYGLQMVDADIGINQ